MPAVTPTPEPYTPPVAAIRQTELRLSEGQTLRYQVEAGFVVLRDKDRPVAEVFTVTYTALSESGARPSDAEAAKRPVTFVFNGGPGAASAYLHLGRLDAGASRAPGGQHRDLAGVHRSRVRGSGGNGLLPRAPRRG